MTDSLFRKYLEEAIGAENASVAFSALGMAASVSVRLNPFKAASDEFLFDGTPFVPALWNPLGRILPQRPVFTLDPIFHAGGYYVQDSSSMFVGEVFRRLVSRLYPPQEMTRPLRVLDLCAAPGGKTTDLCASLRQVYGDNFILVANEVMKQRVGILADNLALWGEPNVLVTSQDPSAFGRIGGYFDIVLADVPCSGEGMFRKDEEALRQWSEENVELCAARQKRIIADLWNCLAEDGVLIYSTCTFNRKENDLNVQWITQELGAEVLTSGFELFLEEELSGGGVLKTTLGYSLVPGHVVGEGQYCSALKKTSAAEPSGLLLQRPRRAEAPRGQQAGSQKSKVDELSTLFDRQMEFRQKGNLLIALPGKVASEMEALAVQLHPLRVGCAVGELKGNDLVPSADLALCLSLNPEAFERRELDRESALKFLHRDAIVLDPECPKGYVLVCHAGLPLGFVKNLGNRCNNLHPMARRIRMDLK